MKRTLVYALAVALLAACTNQEKDFQKTPVQEEPMFYASFEQPTEPGTKVYANEDLLLRWTADDRVSIFNKNTYNQQYQFTGKTGANSGGFKKVETDEFMTGNDIDHVVSVYPYRELTEISESGILTLTLPAEQHYAANTFGLGANTMVSVTVDNFLQYKNVGGYLVFKLYGDGVTVSSITLKGNNGEKLAGNATVTMPVEGLPSLSMASDATGEITLTCDTPVQLGATAEEATQFWFVVPPVTFSKGFTVSLTKTSGAVFEKSTSKSITVERNILSKMSPMEVFFTAMPEPVDLGLPSGLKWATCNLGASGSGSSPNEWGDYYAWGEIEPHYSVFKWLPRELIWKEGKVGYSWSTYKWCNGDENKLTKYCDIGGYPNPWDGEGSPDGKDILDPEDDAAHMVLGGDWRMPTVTEWAELIEYCDWTYSTDDGVGYWVTSKANGKRIFLPFSGYWIDETLYDGGLYWSSSRCFNGAACDVILTGDSVFVDVDRKQGRGRMCGIPIRPVYGEFIHTTGVSLSASSITLNKGERCQLSATVTPDMASNQFVRWSPHTSSVAIVSQGEVIAVGVGTETIIVETSDGGHIATCEVTVVDPQTEVVGEKDGEW